ncbi:MULTISPECIES: hypothetical protein [unclassified Bradyrhizobium]|uniref:hypothetical protein n=1 Tax=unclassified Bradyrhizobium TaxID=2631580 RepID=UPI00247AB2FB|nr:MULTISPECIES: hypothetical protein [unclassified Bradyrhizobium]WGS23235.1 hypothetical protein MTX22_17310 [Bradyrhizobium sp. ISRA463]WGS30244.1 hypothetical protein MTX19_15045 [Bradyrhizobium sp. ISRA464]
MAIAEPNPIPDSQAHDNVAATITHRDDAAHCSNGLSVRKFRDGMQEERAVFRRWIRGVVGFYGILLLASGVFISLNHARVGSIELTSLADRAASR